MGKNPTVIERIFTGLQCRVPDESDLCDILLYYTVMRDHGFPHAKGYLMDYIVRIFKKGNDQWSKLFQYYGTFGREYMRVIGNDMNTGSAIDKWQVFDIFWQLGWIKTLDTSDNTGILLEQLEEIDGLELTTINTFLYNRSLLLYNWDTMFDENFDIIGGIYDTNNIEQT